MIFIPSERILKNIADKEMLTNVLKLVKYTKNLPNSRAYFFTNKLK